MTALNAHSSNRPERQPAGHIDWNEAIPECPFDWYEQLIPCDGNKRPIDPHTGHPMTGWTTANGYDIDGLNSLNGHVKAVGLKLGPASGVLAVDFDGPASIQKFRDVFHRHPSELPDTIGVTSGKPNRGQRLFQVDREWWDVLRGRRYWTDENGDTCLELRWAGHQSIIAGAHPETDGYRWLKDSSPVDRELATAPDWLLEPLAHEKQSTCPVELSADDARRAVNMLQFIDPETSTSYDDWLAVGMALHNTDPGLLHEWVEWSRRMPNFDEAECLRKWDSFSQSTRTGGRRTIRSLHHWAKENGYKEPKAKPHGETSGNDQPPVVDEQLLPLSERITNRVQELLQANMANNPSEIDAAFSELFKLGVRRDRAQERILMMWAENNGLDISTNAKPCKQRGRIVGKAPEGKGLRQQLPGFGIDKDLHLLVADAGGGKTTAMCELVTVMTARDKGFLDHEAPRTDPTDDPRTKALVIAADGEASAFSMWEDYLQTLDSVGRGATVEVWAQDDDTGETSWNVSLHNLERLVQRMAQGDVAVVVMDTANAILRGAGVDPGIGPVETYLRLLKQIVCRHAPLWITQHTNRGGGTTMKAIGGHPAFQEVPSAVHLIETKAQADGTKMRVWHVLKFRGSGYRSFSFELSDGELKVTDGHFFHNCNDQVLVLMKQQQESSGLTSPGELIRLSQRPPQSVYNALNELRAAKWIRAKGRGYRITAAGERHLDSLRAAQTRQPL